MSLNAAFKSIFGTDMDLISDKVPEIQKLIDQEAGHQPAIVEPRDCYRRLSDAPIVAEQARWID